MSDVKEYKILVADDDKDIVDLICGFIGQHNYLTKVLTATDGRDALRKIENQSFDLVITDLNMPHVSGKALIAESKKLSAAQRPKAFLVISGDITKEILKPGNAGVSVLSKPFDIEKFTKYFEIVLSQEKLASIKKIQKKSNAINVEFINPFIDATLEVIDVMANVKAEKDFVSIRDSDDCEGDITGIVALNGTNYVGSLAITFTSDVYLKIMSNMLGEEYTEINDENKDGVAELCNQIYGNGRIALNDIGFGLGSAIPTVIYGPGHKICHAAQGPILASYFKTDYGRFVIECVLVPK